MKALKCLFTALFVFLISFNPAFAMDEDFNAEEAMEKAKNKSVEKFEKKGITFTKSQISEIDKMYEEAYDELLEKTKDSAEPVTDKVVGQVSSSVNRKILADVLTKSQQDIARKK